MTEEDVLNALELSEALEVGHGGHPGSLDAGGPGILFRPGEVVVGVVARNDHEGLEPDALGAGSLELGQDVVEAVGAFDGGEPDVGIGLVEGGGSGGEGQVAGAAVVAVAHEHHGVAGLAILGQGSEHHLDDGVEILFRDEERIADLDRLEYAGILGDVFDDHAFELVVFLGGGDVQGLDLEIGHALRGELIHRGVDGEDGLAFLGQLVPDDVRGEGQKHGFIPGGFLVGLFDVVDCGPCTVHRSSEGDEQGARLGEGGSGHQQAAQQNHDETFFHGPEQEGTF